MVAGLLLSLVDYGFTGWLAVGILLSVAAAWSPRLLLAWVLILYLAAGRLAHHASLSWQFLVVLAGVQLLQVLGMLAIELPWRSWVQPQVLVAPLRRFLVIQVPTQLLAILALLLLAPSPDGHRPLTIAGFGVVGDGLPVVGALIGVLIVPVPVDWQDSDIEATVPVIGSGIEEIGVPAGTLTVKVSFWPVTRVTVIVQVSACAVASGIAARPTIAAPSASSHIQSFRGDIKIVFLPRQAPRQRTPALARLVKLTSRLRVCNEEPTSSSIRRCPAAHPRARPSR